MEELEYSKGSSEEQSSSFYGFSDAKTKVLGKPCASTQTLQRVQGHPDIR
jgi:hypothetical protein